MVNLDGHLDGDNVVISQDSFEHILNCLANQKYIGELPQNGDSLSEGMHEYYKVQQENQQAIDNCWRQGMDLLCSNIKGEEK